MAIVKLTGKKTGVMFVDDDGNVFITSKKFLENMLASDDKTRLVLLSRLPIKVSDGRFKKSPLFDPDGEFARQAQINGTTITRTNDALSGKRIQEAQDSKNFIDKKVW